MQPFTHATLACPLLARAPRIYRLPPLVRFADTTQNIESTERWKSFNLTGRQSLHPIVADRERAVRKRGMRHRNTT
jgi:hypothetical protein